MVRVPLCKLLRKRAVYGILVAHCVHNYGSYVLLSWLPKFFLHLGVALEEVGTFAVFPYICIFLIDNLWGAAMDTAITQGKITRLAARKLSQSVAFMGPAVSLTILIVAQVRSPMTANLLISLALGINSVSHSGYWANLIDLSPQHAGVLCGLSNTIATLPGVFGNLITGLVLSITGSWTAVFAFFVLLYIVGLHVYLRDASVEPIEVYMRSRAEHEGGRQDEATEDEEKQELVRFEGTEKARNGDLGPNSRPRLKVPPPSPRSASGRPRLHRPPTPLESYESLPSV